MEFEEENSERNMRLPDPYTEFYTVAEPVTIRYADTWNNATATTTATTTTTTPINNGQNQWYWNPLQPESNVATINITNDEHHESVAIKELTKIINDLIEQVKTLRTEVDTLKEYDKDVVDALL